MAMKQRVLSDIFTIRTPHDLVDAVLSDVNLSASNDDGGLVARAYDVAVLLYGGKWEHYLACDTNYHDMWHAAETFLAMGRLISGALCVGAELTTREMALGLTAAILHDSGYIRTVKESDCQGARFRAVHEQRSKTFLTRHGGQLGLSADDITACRSMIQCTVMTEDISAITFKSESVALLGRMLAVADLLSQLSSSIYLEKILDLYEEDQGASHPRYTDIKDCFRKAIAFDPIARQRFRVILPAADSYLKAYFETRWKYTQNLYALATERQKQRLATLLRRTDFEPRRHLRRWGSLEATRRVFE